jgi:hypothetical protein
MNLKCDTDHSYKSGRQGLTRESFYHVKPMALLVIGASCSSSPLVQATEQCQPPCCMFIYLIAD